MNSNDDIPEPLTLDTPRLQLALESTDDILARIDAMPAEYRAMVSPLWIEQLRATPEPSPWTHSFVLHDRSTGLTIGSCSFKGPPGDDGSVEIAYAINESQRGRGYAKEGAAALVAFALQHENIRIVRAHTLPEESASTSILRACGFDFLGDVMDPEDGRVWRWELTRNA
jgi:RimJ/RimL family protein N-acetyltransferase